MPPDVLCKTPLIIILFTDVWLRRPSFNIVRMETIHVFRLSDSIKYNAIAARRDYGVAPRVTRDDRLNRVSYTREIVSEESFYEQWISEERPRNPIRFC